MDTTIPKAIAELLQIVQNLHKAYPQKRFTLDGRLVGDIGEVLASIEYDIELYPNLQKHHDAKTLDAKLVQIKATMQNSLTYPADHVPDYYLGIKINPDGSISEVFNGPGLVAYEAVKNRQKPKTNLHSVSLGALKALNQKVNPIDRIKKRKI